MLLASGFVRVDQAAASGPGYDSTAAQYITKNGGRLFSSTHYEYTHPSLDGNAEGSLSPEQLALPRAVVTGANGKTMNTTFVFIKDNVGIVRFVTGISTKK